MVTQLEELIDPLSILCSWCFEWLSVAIRPVERVDLLSVLCLERVERLPALVWLEEASGTLSALRPW